MKIDTNGIATRYQLEGPVDAPVVTLSHALAANLHRWDAQATALADRLRVLEHPEAFNHALLECLGRVR